MWWAFGRLRQMVLSESDASLVYTVSPIIVRDEARETLSENYNNTLPKKF